MKKNILFITMIVFGCCSCSDFLKPKSPSEYVPETVEALNEMLLGDAYPRADRGTTTSLFAYHNVLDDDVEMTKQSLEFKKSIDDFIALYSWDPDMQEIGLKANVWSGYYQMIMGANAALDYLDEVNGTAEDKAYVRAQAYVLRAFYYFHLVNLFGEPYGYNKQAPGVPLKLTSALSDKFEKRNTVEEVYRQIVEDLDAAEKNFLALPKSRQCMRNFRINLPAVQLLRARVCLYMGNMAAAAGYAKKVINDWDYNLYDLRTFDSTATQPFPNYVRLSNPETIWTYGDARDITQLTSSYGYLENSQTATAKVLNVSQGLENCYGNGDLRKARYLVPESAKSNCFVPYSKMMIQYNYAYVHTTEFGYSLRLSEAYLILAEAVYDTDKELALELINELREKRYKAEKYQPVSYSGNDLLNFIRDERRRELCLEGHRWFDLRRYGMPSFKHRWVEKGVCTGYYVMEKDDAAYTLPIPSIIMERNPALEQNRLTERKVVTL